MLDLGEDLLDGVEIGRLGRQKRELCAGIEDRCSNRLGAVASQIIEDNDVAWPQRGDQELLDVGAENHSVDRAIDDARLGQSADPEGGEKRQRVPAPIGSKAGETLALGAPAPDRSHIGLDPGLINEHEPRRVEMAARPFPAFTPPDDVRPVLLGREERFF